MNYPCVGLYNKVNSQATKAHLTSLNKVQAIRLQLKERAGQLDWLTGVLIKSAARCR